jgi:hypothetical protein
MSCRLLDRDEVAEGLAQLQEEAAKAWRLRCEVALALRDLDGATGALQRALAIAFAIDNRAQVTIRTQAWKTHLAWTRRWTARKRPDQARDA